MSGPDFSAPRGWPGPPPPSQPAWSPGLMPPPVPPPGYPAGPYRAPPAPVEWPRPIAIPLTVCLTVTAALLWMSALSTAWLMALLGQQSLRESPADLDSRTVLLINHFTARLADGLAWPLFGLPLVAVVLAFLLVMRRGWPRILYTVWGALSIVWLTWWLRDNLLVAVAPVVYVAVAVLLVWLPSVTQWLDRRDRRPESLSAGVGSRAPR